MLRLSLPLPAQLPRFREEGPPRRPGVPLRSPLELPLQVRSHAVRLRHLRLHRVPKRPRNRATLTSPPSLRRWATSLRRSERILNSTLQLKFQLKASRKIFVLGFSCAGNYHEIIGLNRDLLMKGATPDGLRQEVGIGRLPALQFNEWLCLFRD